MTTITDKITQALETLQIIDDAQEFTELCTMLRNDLLGFSKNIPLKKISKRYGLEPMELEQALDALSYLILHLAKVNANEQEFDIIYEQSALKPLFKQAFFETIFPHISEIRKTLERENNKNVKNFRDLEWRLNLVTATRARQKIMVPKYTVRLALEESGKQGGEPKNESLVMDIDYTNLKRIQTELEEALKAVNATYAKKVTKFLK